MTKKQRDVFRTSRECDGVARDLHVRSRTMRLLFWSLLSFCLLPAFSWSQTTGTASPTEPLGPVSEAQVEAPKTPPSQAPPVEKHNYYLELGGFYSRFTPGTSSWRGADVRMIYSGWKKITPFGGFSTQGTSIDSQQNFGMGSYFNFGKKFYAIGGFSVSPNSAVIFYPRARFDVAGMFSIEKVKGLVLSTGFTELRPYRTIGGGGRIYSVGGIYYHRIAILSGSVNFNEAFPGSRRSTSGQFGIMRGTRGKYYLNAGISGGKVAYQLVANVPFDVRYNTIGDFVSFQKWLSKHFGIIIRYDYQRAFENFGRHSIKSSMFFEF